MSHPDHTSLPISVYIYSPSPEVRERGLGGEGDIASQQDH
jgi:hypothetical protein